MALDYEGFPYISFIDERIQKGLNNRISLDNRTRNISAWVKMTSGVQQIKATNSRSEIEYNDGKLYTLQSIFTTNSSSIEYGFDNIYNPSNNIPEAGIISIEVKYTGEYGGVRVAQIKWQANSLDQFQKYAPYFLNPGRTILLEWGWSNDYNIYELSRAEYDNIKFDKTMEAWEYLNNRSLQAYGLYDGLLGVVTNYNFSLREDGGFDIMTEVTSQGGIIYGLNLVNQSNVSAQGENTDEYQKTIKNFVRDELNDVVANWPKLANNIINMLPGKKLSPDVDVYVDTIPNKKFVTWGFIEDIIVNPWIGIRFGKKSDGLAGKPMFQLQSIDKSNWYTDGTSIGYRSVKISNHKDLRTTNLDICFINNSNSPDAIKFSSPADNGIDNTEADTGYLRNIYVNYETVYNAFDSSDTLTDALIKILNDISSACIHYWDFNLKINEKDQTLRVIDANYCDKFLGKLINSNKNTDNDNVIKKIYLFRLYGGNGLIKDINFSSRLSNDITMTSLYSNNKQKDDNYIINNDTDAFRSIWNTNGIYTDYFYESLYYKTQDRSLNLNPEKGNVKIDSLKTYECNSSYDNALQFLPQTEENVDQVVVMKKLVYGKSETEDQKSNLIIPADFEMTIEGTAGIRIGDVFWVDAVPDMYIENAVFQVTGISHIVQDNYWSTIIKAMLRVTNAGVSAKNVKSDKTRTGVSTPKIKQIIQSINTDGRDTSIVSAADKAETLDLLKQIWQDKSIEGFKVSDEILNDAAIIINGESSFRPNNFNTVPPDYSLGLFQINLIKPDLYNERIKWSDLGIIKDKASIHPTTGKLIVHHNLWDKKTNIKVAKRIFKQSNYSWKPWSASILLNPNRVKPPRNEIT